MPLLTGSHKLQPGTFRAFVMNEAKFSFVKKHYIRSKCPLKHFYRKFLKLFRRDCGSTATNLLKRSFRCKTKICKYVPGGHSLMLLWFADLMNVTEEVTNHQIITCSRALASMRKL